MATEVGGAYPVGIHSCKTFYYKCTAKLLYNARPGVFFALSQGLTLMILGDSQVETEKSPSWSIG